MAGGGETTAGLAGTTTTGGATINACLGAEGSAGGATGEGLTSIRGAGPGIGVLKEGERAGRENGSRLSGPRLGRGLEAGAIGARGARDAERGGPTGAGVAKVG